MQRMLRESQLVGQARAELQGGNAAAALRTLATLDEQIPRGNLRQEREVLTIEALSASGQRAAAGQRAEAFLRLFPRSPYAARLQAFVPGR
jgi:outer membrane protein assembly factor BamD (BamD/ComL family)